MRESGRPLLALIESPPVTPFRGGSCTLDFGLKESLSALGLCASARCDILNVNIAQMSNG